MEIGPAKKPGIKDHQLEAIVIAYLAKGDYRTAAKLMWPWYIQNEWSDRIWKAIETYPNLCIMGHGSATKTFISSIYFLCDWLRWMSQTALIITSDTIPSMDRRIWADFKTLWSKSRINLSKMASIVDSKRMIRRDINDSKNAVHGIAAESDDAQSKIQGLHTKRIRVVFDEADNPYASSIWSALSNLGTSGDLRFVALANPRDKNSEFGNHCEPVDGWDSINPETDFEWKSKLGCHVLRLDGLESPNLAAGEDKFPFMLTNKGVNDIIERKGKASQEWWTYVRGWYPPEGLIKNIFSGGIVSKAMQNKITWYTTKTAIASLDPAFEGGDNCSLCLGFMGRMADNPERTAVEASEFITIKRKDMDKTLGFDYADQIVAILKDRGVEPKHFTIDVTGTQGPFADIIEHKLGKGMLRVRFGASATDRRVTNEDRGVARERYKNLVTELWYVAREWCRMGLVYIKDPPRDLRIQLEARRYELKGKDAQSGREVIMAEPKVDMKERGLSSPDEGDAFCMLINLARTIEGGFLPGTFKDEQREAKRAPFQRSVFTHEQEYEKNEE